MTKLERKLTDFAASNSMSGKGGLCVALVVTRHARATGLPLIADDLLTEGGGQVAGLGKGAVQAILRSHGIRRVLAEEGGRTSRGSVGNMRNYVDFLNVLHRKGLADTESIEDWWIDRVRAYFAAKPFVLRLDASRSLRSSIRDLLHQAQKRQADSPGTMFAGTVLQHLVGAKLALLLGRELEHHGASVADDASGRQADFLIEDVAIHVTTAPSEAVLRKCMKNLDAGLRPMLITLQRGVLVAEELASQVGIADRLDVFEGEQFLAGNVYELGKFADMGRRATARQIVDRYNGIVDACETDPSLRIEVA